MNLDEFIERVIQRPLPPGAMARVRTLAKEMAEGAAESVWPAQFELGTRDQETGRIRANPDSLTHYFERRWENDIPDIRLLEQNAYLEVANRDRFWSTYIVGKDAFALVEDVEPYNVFISYRRADSSAFALLLMIKLQQAGLNPFLDLALVPGEDWNEALKNRIGACDFFVVLLGPTTLESQVVRDEIGYAIEAKKTIIPMWHNEFEYQSGEWADVSVAVDRALSYSHTIRVIKEGPLEYNNAVLELLNRFGYTPAL